MINGIRRTPSNPVSYSRSAVPSQAGQPRFQNRLIDKAIHSDNSLNGKQAVIYMNCLVSQVSGSGQELHMKYDESSTDLNPVIYAWGKDSSGNAFETKIVVNDIVPYNASPAEMKALHAHLAKQEGSVKSTSLPIDVAMSGYDVNQKLDFVQYLGEWNAMQELAKNPAADLKRLQLEQYLSFWQQNQNVNDTISQHQDTLTKNQESILKILETFGVKLTNGINWNSDGSCELTEAQAKDLRERYDMEGLSTDEYYTLLVELVNLNVISGDDFEKQFIRHASPETAEYGYMLTAASPGHFDTEGNDYLEKLLNDAEMYEYYIQALGSRKSSVHASNITKMSEYYKEEKACCEKLANILGQLQYTEKTSEAAVQPDRSFNGLDVLGPSAPDKVKDAWMKAEEESGTNGYGMNSEGMLTQITTLFAMSIENMVNGKGQDVLGTTVDSARAAVQRALGRLGIPQNDKEKKEKLFYEAFLRLL